MERFFALAVQYSPQQAVEVYELLARQARYTTADLQQFHEQHRQDQNGFLRYLESRHLWNYHRKYLLESLSRREKPPAEILQGEWQERLKTRDSFRPYFSSTQEVDAMIQPSYEMTGSIQGPIQRARLRIEAKGSPAMRAYPYVYVKLDDMILDAMYIDSDDFRSYYTPIRIPAGNHTLTLQYVNDFTDHAANRYRNLWIRDVVIEESLPAREKGAHAKG